jgi:hypothetical protein
MSANSDFNNHYACSDLVMTVKSQGFQAAQHITGLFSETAPHPRPTQQ